MSGTVADGDFFSLAERKLEWLQQRNSVIAGNVANSNTPGYVAKDITPFEQTLAGATVQMAGTDEGEDIGATAGSGTAETVADETRENSPDKNGVSLDHQLTMLAQTQDQQGEVTTLYKRYNSMVTTALGLGAGS